MQVPTVLVVEDDALFVRMLQRLAGKSLTLENAPSLASARSALDNRRKILGCAVDIGLPDGDGLELLDEIGRSRPGLPTLIMNGSISGEAATRAASRGALFACKGVDSFDDAVTSFLFRCRAHACAPNAIAETIAIYAMRWGLGGTQCRLLAAAVAGVRRPALAHHLEISDSMVTWHIGQILARTRLDSLADVVAEVLRSRIGA